MARMQVKNKEAFNHIFILPDKGINLSGIYFRIIGKDENCKTIFRAQVIDAPMGYVFIRLVYAT